MGRTARRPDRASSPRPASLVVLALTALVLLATGAARPTIETEVTSEVRLAPSTTVEEIVTVRIDAAAGTSLGSGAVEVALLAAHGLDRAVGDAVSVVVDGPAGTDRVRPGTVTVPIESCRDGCELRYRLRIVTTDAVLPGSIGRYRVDVRLTTASDSGGQATISVPAPVASTPPAVWAALAGAIAILVGIAAGPALHRRLGSRARWPARLLAALAAAVLAIQVLQTARTVLAILGAGGSVAGSIRTALGAIDLWSIGLLLVLTWGLARGLRSWSADGGWRLGAAAVAAAGLGGLWLAWIVTRGVAFQPILGTVGAIVLGALAGLVAGGPWMTDSRARYDRAWTTAAVLAHGVLIAGFAFLAVGPNGSPGFGPQALVFLVPAVVVLGCLGRWFTGRPAPLRFIDLVIAGIGLLGAWLWSLGLGASTSGLVAIDDVAVGLAVVASIVALVTSFHRMPTHPVDPADADAIAVSPPATDARGPDPATT